jgi:catechol 2,3-dioxygenase-like lactoylglutathione lyase family enzyme
VTAADGDGVEINGVAHVLHRRPDGPRALCFRARSREDVDAVHEFVKGMGAEIVRAPVEGPWAPGYHSTSFRDPEGIRLELNHVPGTGLLASGSTFLPDPEYPISG